ncbi:hypothetical protein ACE103_16010 [Bradyrhizobium sp. ma5]|uniref:hypothetical protein n=1 Tax=Bradyrhizobium sp. ma5 TaxID=3344828 RepID=UPI0035D3F3FF
MRPATFKGKLRFSNQFALAYVGVEAFFWFGFFLVVVLGCSYSVYLGLAIFICWALTPALLFRRVLKLDIKALDDPNDNPRANRLISKISASYSIRGHWYAPRPAANPSPDSRMTRACGASRHATLRFAAEFFKSVAIIIALTLGTGFTAEMIAFALSDRDISGTFESGLVGIAGGVLGFVLAVVIVVRRIADTED